eukprot:1160572-Pelagomonas_calceolata.AAC.1
MISGCKASYGVNLSQGSQTSVVSFGSSRGTHTQQVRPKPWPSSPAALGKHWGWLVWHALYLAAFASAFSCCRYCSRCCCRMSLPRVLQVALEGLRIPVSAATHCKCKMKGAHTQSTPWQCGHAIVSAGALSPFCLTLRDIKSANSPCREGTASQCETCHTVNTVFKHKGDMRDRHTIKNETTNT